MTNEKDHGRLARLIDNGFRISGLNGKKVAREVGTTGSDLSRFIKGERCPNLGVLRNLAHYLRLDFGELLDAWLEVQIQAVDNNRGKDEKVERQDQIRKGLERLRKDLGEGDRLWPRRPPREGPVTLNEWRHLEIKSIIVGDRRDRPPDCKSDIMADTASVGDLFFLHELRKPLRIWFDKISCDENLFESFDHDILVVGSPAVNLVSRIVNRDSLFRFFVDGVAYEYERHFEDKLETTRIQSFFESVTDNERKKLDDMHRCFRGSYFLDPMTDVHVGVSARRNNHYGIVSLARHPVRPDRIAILCGGIHGAATAASLRILGKPQSFEERPFGGVFTCVMSKKETWDDLEPRWVTEPYSVEKYEFAIRNAGQEWASMSELVDLLRSRSVELSS